jgi:hypothetical protein
LTKAWNDLVLEAVSAHETLVVVAGKHCELRYMAMNQKAQLSDGVKAVAERFIAGLVKSAHQVASATAEMSEARSVAASAPPSQSAAAAEAFVPAPPSSLPNGKQVNRSSGAETRKAPRLSTTSTTTTTSTAYCPATDCSGFHGSKNKGCLFYKFAEEQKAMPLSADGKVRLQGKTTTKAAHVRAFRERCMDVCKPF